MAHRVFTLKHPNASEIFGFDLVNLVGPNEFIQSVTAKITLKKGVDDPDMNTMLLDQPYFAGAKVWHLVGGGIDGNYYYITFTVTTSSQVLEIIGTIPVATGA